MGEQMNFPNTFEEFAEAYGIDDIGQIYTNGSKLIPVFRAEQWIEHLKQIFTQEIEGMMKYCQRETEMAKLDTLKQFCERLKEKADDFDMADGAVEIMICIDFVDDLEKEMREQIEQLNK